MNNKKNFLCLLMLIISSSLFSSYFEYWYEMGDSALDNSKKIEYYSKAIENWRVYDGEENLALAYLKRGMVYYSLKDYQKAIEDFNSSIKNNKKLIDAYFYRGKIYLESKDYKKAISDFSEVIKLDENDEYHKANGGISYYYRALIYFNTGDKQLALEDLKKAFSFDKKNYEYYLLRGKIYEEFNELDIALDDYSTCISLKPDNLEAYIRRAKIYLNKNNTSDALKDLSEAIKIDNQNVDVYLLRADIHITNKSFNDAINDLTKVIELKYDTEQVRYKRASLYFQIKAYDKAIKDFKECLEKNPQYEQYNVAYYLARSYEELKDFDNSLEWYIKVSKIKPSKEILFKIAKIYYDKNILNESLEYLNKVLDLDKGHIDALLLRSNINFLNSNFDECIKDLSTLVSLGKTSSEIYYKLGLCNYKKTRYEEAILNLNKAIELDPSGDCGSKEPASAYYYRAESYYQKRNFSDALKDFTKVIQLNPNNKTAYLQRGKIYFENKLFNEAIRDLTEAINSGIKDKETVLIRAKAFYNTKDYKNATQDLKELVDFYGEKDFEIFKMLAYSCLFTQNISEAIEYFSEALKLKEDINLLLERANLYYKNNMIELAKDDLNKILQLESANKEALFLLTKINFETNSYEEAITLSNQLLFLRPTDYYILYIRGVSYFKVSNIDEAIKDITKAVQLDLSGDCGSGTKGEGYYILANLYELKSEKRKAIENYAKTIQVNPKYKEAYLKKANLHFDFFETTSSLKDLNTYLTFEPNSSNALFLKGRIYFETGEYSQAEAIFKKIIEMEIPEDIKVQAYILLSKCLTFTGKYDLAKEILTDNNLLTNDILFKLPLAEVYYYEGNLEATLNQLENVFLLSDDPNLKSEAYLLKLRIYLELLEDQKAELLLAEAEEFLTNRIKEDPRNYRNYYILSLIYSLMKINPQEALKLARKSVELLGHPDSYYALGLSFLINNEIEKAMQSLKKALQINPNHIFSLYELAKIFKETLKRPTDAEVYYKKLLNINPNFRFLQ